MNDNEMDNITSVLIENKRLKEENESLRIAAHFICDDDVEVNLRNQVYQQELELSRLREREKELVEALREFCQAVRKSDEKYPDWVGTSEVYGALFKSESLLSKFEVPNV